jgi:type I restriction enzyme S subunit
MIHQRIKLGDHIETLKGYAFKSEWYLNEGIPIVRVSNFTEDTISDDGLNYINIEIASNYKKYSLEIDDIIIQTVGSWPNNPNSVVGKVIRVPIKFRGALLNQNAVKLIPRSEINKKYLFYCLKNESFKEYIINCAQGAANQASITLESIREFEFDLPSIETQTKIAYILSAYDDLIENNTRRIQILEQMAQTIYKEWFVNFHFPGYENTKFIDSAIGKIPEGWGIKKASEAITINPRVLISKTEKIPFVTMDKLSYDSMIINSWDYCINKNGSKFQNNDTLFARITPCLENGKTGFVQFLNEDGIGVGSTEFIVLRSNSLSPEYVYLLSRQHDFRSNAINSMAGASGRQRVHVDCFNKYLLANPEKEILNLFTKTIRPLFRQINCLNEKNNILHRTRDLLLPKLMSGEVEV